MQQKKQLDPQTRQVIETVGVRNAFIPAAMERLSRIAIWTSAVSMALILALAAIYIFRPAPQSYAVTPDGRIMPLIPVNQGLGQEAVIDFTSRAVIAAFSMDFLNWKKQLGALAPMFTERGYNAYMEAITPLKDRVVKGRYITQVSLASPMVIVKSKVIQKVMKYRLRGEIIISLEGQAQRIPPQLWEVDVIVERVPMSRSPVGLQISSIIAKPK